MNREGVEIFQETDMEMKEQRDVETISPEVIIEQDCHGEIS